MLSFKKLFLSTTALSVLIGSFESHAMEPEMDNLGGHYRVLTHIPDLPSRFIRENKATLPYSLFSEEDRIKYYNNTEALFNKYLPIFDSMYTPAIFGNIDCAGWLCKFYQSLQFRPGPIGFGCPTKEEAEESHIRSYDIAKKFAKIAAEGGGSAQEYIFLTGLGYAHKRENYGKEMEECTRWMIKDFLKNPYDPRNPNQFFCMINSGTWESRYVDQKSLASLENYILTSYHKNGDVRVAKALMYLKGFWGNTEKMNERAFRIACQECVLSDKKDSTSHNGTFGTTSYNHTLGTAGTVLFDLVKKLRYDPEKDHSLYELGMYGYGNTRKPLQIIQQSTRLLQYYNILPEQIDKQIKNNKKSLQLDLHGYDKGMSTEEVMQLLNYLTTHNDIRSCVIITGRGTHSPGGQPKLKPLIERLLKGVSEDQTFPIGYEETSKGGAFKVWKRG